MKSKAQLVLDIIGNDAGSSSALEAVNSAAMSWLKKHSGEFRAIEQKLKQLEAKFEKEVQYDAGKDPHSEAVHSTLVALWDIVGSVAAGSFESAASTMSNQGNYMRKELV